jgi:hypothetical protein
LLSSCCPLAAFHLLHSTCLLSSSCPLAAFRLLAVLLPPTPSPNSSAAFARWARVHQRRE